MLNKKMDLKDACILVTPTSYGKNDLHLKSDLEAQVGKVIYNPTGKPLSSSEVDDLLPGVDGYIAGLDVIDNQALQAADRLKVIARYGVGVDKVDLLAAREKGITVTYTPSANATSVAELTLCLILALARQIPLAIQATVQGQWPRLTGVSLEGKAVGILGLGAIGKQLARRLAGFDCQILAHDPYPDLDFAARNGVAFVEQDTLLNQADFVSLHLPLLPETTNLVDRNFLAKMKKGAYLINTSRGDMVDEAALLEALESGALSGAALDTFKLEPPDPENSLLKHPHLIATPHLGAQTDGATNRMGWMALNDCLAVLRGEMPLYRVLTPGGA